LVLHQAQHGISSKGKRSFATTAIVNLSRAASSAQVTPALPAGDAILPAQGGRA
jgi:hypothetical protein